MRPQAAKTVQSRPDVAESYIVFSCLNCIHLNYAVDDTVDRQIAEVRTHRSRDSRLST